MKTLLDGALGSAIEWFNINVEEINLSRLDSVKVEIDNYLWTFFQSENKKYYCFIDHNDSHFVYEFIDYDEWTEAIETGVGLYYRSRY